MTGTQPDSAPPIGQELITALFYELESPLLRYALRLLPDRGQAEDVVQEAFMRLHAQSETIREPKRWLYRTVHNLAFNARRDDSKIVRFETTPDQAEPNPNDAPDVRPWPDEQIVRLEGIGLVRFGLERLDARSREVVRLKFNDDLSYREISQRTGLSEGNVGYILHHALKTLADGLRKAGLLS